MTLYVLLAVGGLLGCEKKHIVVEGREVQQVKKRWGLFWGMPFPGPIWQVYYVYTDDSGNKVKHGPYESFDRDGRLDYSAFYRDGRLDGTLSQFGKAGEKLQDSFYRAGKLIGQANYEHGHLVYENEAVFRNERQVGEKHFENGHWSLSFRCGNEIDRRIDAETGEITNLVPPLAIACRH